MNNNKFYDESIFSIGDKKVGSTEKCFIIAEIAQAHDGSLGMAHAYIDAVSRTGADAIKFQTHIASAESTKFEKFRVQVFPQDKTRYEYWKRMEFTCTQWKELAEHAKEVGLIFLSSPFSVEAVQLLDNIGMPAWKIGSGEVDNKSLIDAVSKTGKPILLSTGMSKWSDIDKTINIVKSYGNPISVFQCTTSYPCSSSNLGLNNINELKERYGFPVGFSDHSGNIFSGLAAVTLGASIIEVHTVFSKECFGPDVSSSITIDELSQLVSGVRFIDKAINSPVLKDDMASKLLNVKVLFTRSIFVSKDLSIGHILTKEDFTFKKPGIGISQERADEFIGRVVTRNYCMDDLLEEEYIK